MAKILEATCVGGIVKVGALPVDAEILSEGVAASSGILILDGDQATYIPLASTDLKTTLEKLSAALTDLTSVLTTIATTATAIGAGMTGPTTAPPPTLAANVAQITAKVVSLTAIQAQVDLLKAGLI